MLTTVHQPVRDMGKRATEELLLGLQGKGEPRMVEVEYQMRLRASTAPAR
jgi:LacI family transcriptional regulator